MMYNNIIDFNIREDDIMCRLLKELKGLTAEQLLEKYNISPKPPIDISLLLKRIGISEIPMDFTQIEKIMNYQFGDVLGAIFAKNDSLGIFYRQGDSVNRIRFTLAHEIAHCCIHADTLEKRHIELRSALSATTTKEYKANVFAGELLIPESTLKEIHNRYLIAPPLSNIAQIFKVSTNVMAARLEYLNLPYIRDTKPSDE